MKKLLPIALLFLYKIALAQNVGIGTLTPQARLHVADSSVLFTSTTALPGTAGNPPISGSGNRMMWYADKAAFRVGQSIDINWDKDNTGDFSFAAGVGTKASGVASTSFGGSTIATGNLSTSMGDGTIAKAYGSLSIGTNNDPYDNPTGTSLDANDRIFQIGNGNFINPTNAMTVLRNGNVGIGSLAPNQKLVVKGSNPDVMLIDGGSGMYATFSENGTPRGFVGSYNGNDEDFQIGTYAGSTGNLNLTTNSQQRLSVKFNGNVGIGITSPTEKLHVIGNILSSGTITPSDFRYKKDILDIANPLEKVKQLRGVTYNLRSSEFPEMQFDTKEQIGLIAQEVEKVLPNVVHTSSNGYKGVEYEKIVPLLIEGMKEQQKQIDQQNKISIAQQKEIDELKIAVQKLLNK
jgi:hypothetical protein